MTTKKFHPKTLFFYLIKEFSLLLIISTGIFVSLIILTTFVEELIFIKQKEILENVYLKTLSLTLIKTPTIFLAMSPFVFLFSGIFFFIKFKKNHESTSLNITGLSDNFITLVPSIYSFLIGCFLVIFLTPISSSLTKYYETYKKKLSDNDNLIIISNTGIWMKENKNSNTHIIRADKLEFEGDDYFILKNLSVFILEKNEKIKKIINADTAELNKKLWLLKDIREIEDNKIIKKKQSNYESNIMFEDLVNFFNNSNTFSIWNILNELDKIKERGYSGQEIIITFHKFLSLPILLFCMIVISSLFTLKSQNNYNNFAYTFIGIFLGIIIYFLIDLSIAMGKSGTVPIMLSVWMPTLMLTTVAFYRIIKNNE